MGAWGAGGLSVFLHPGEVKFVPDSALEEEEFKPREFGHGSRLRRRSANAAGNQFPCGTLSDHWWARQSTFAETHGNEWEAPIAA